MQIEWQSLDKKIIAKEDTIMRKAYGDIHTA